ncbi:unnamed protein product [Lota lota]
MSGDDVITHPSRKKSKSVPAGHTPLLDMPGTHEEELHLNQKEKKKRRREAECMETIDLDNDDRGRGQERTSEGADQSATQETTQRKKKKEKVVIDEEEEGEEDREVSVVVETSITKKKKKHKNATVEENDAVVTTNDNGQNAAKSKKQSEKKINSVVVTESMDVTSDLGVERLERQPVAHGSLPGDVPFCKEKKKGRRIIGAQEINEELGRGVDFSLLPELMLYVPDIGSRSPEIIQKMLRQDLKRFREFRQKGIQLRWGRFLKQENLKIQENVANFLAVTGIATGNQLFYPERYKDQMENIKSLRVAHNFMERIAEDIPRPCFKVYTRGKKIFDDLNYMGRFTKEENLKLQKLQQIHGNDWRTISHGMERSSFSVQKRFSMITTATGAWSQEEVDMLVEAMKLHLEKLAGENQPGSDDGADAGSGPGQLWLTKRQLYHKLPWKSISEKVTGRSWVQCREKWFSILKPKIATQKKVQRGGVKSVLPKITLINTLYAMDLEDAAEIDWEQVANCLGNVTPHTAQKLFNCLKITKVPHSSVLSFCDLIDFLHDKVVPMLRRKVMLDDSCPLPEQEEEVQERYLLSDIFSEEVFMELDNTT